jgi:hypothetical protein
MLLHFARKIGLTLCQLAKSAAGEPFRWTLRKKRIRNGSKINPYEY